MIFSFPRQIRASSLAVLFFAATARAGDNTAHTAAMEKAAQQVQAEAQYSMGVGAPLVNGVATTGLFQIPTDDSVSCAYDPSAKYGDGSCPYAGLNGKSINEPDNWSCMDSNQPPKMTAFNSALSYPQSLFAALAITAFDEASLVCNWTHFVNNPAIPGLASAAAATQITADWADEIPASIAANGAGDWACTVADWQTYYKRIGNELHYIQDTQSEDHADGNLVCTAADSVPLAAFNQLFTFKDVRTCAGFLTQTVQNAEGPDALHPPPTVLCDQAVLSQPEASGVPMTVNTSMITVLDFCSVGASLSCMGLERTLRHHCKLPGQTKSLNCSGPPSDHISGGNPLYCEGELFTGGGQDFITPATSASVPILEAAAARWADVCKQPDDPCVPAQCNTWCNRSATAGDPANPIALSGYCTNATPDSNCVLHTCTCLLPASCGLLNNPCCTTGTPCADPANECGSATGTCVPAGTGTCNPWVGTWAGSITSTCGSYSGPLTVVITAAGANTLNLTYSGSDGLAGGYALTFDGNSAQSSDGTVQMTLSGNTIAVSEADSCQTGTYTRQ